jgi:hypothetical protein
LGNKIAQLQSEIRELASNPFIREGLDGRAVNGFETLAKDPHYLMRVWDARKVSDAAKTYTDETIEELIFGAMQSANPHIPVEKIRRAAKGFGRAVVNRAHGIDELMFGNVSAENIDELTDAMVRHAGMTREDAADLLRDIAGKADDAGRVSVAKHRAILDEKFGLYGPNAPKRSDGVIEEKGLGIEDLLVNDASHLFNSYARQMAGMVSLARFRIKDPATGELLVNGITRDSEFDRLVRLVQKRNADLMVEGKMTQAEADEAVKGLQFAYNYIRGRPNWDADASRFGEITRMLRGFNFSRVMNQVGFAQVPEAALVVSTLGVKAAFSQVPSLRRILSESGESIRASGLADDLETFLPSSVDNLIHRSEARFDDLSGSPHSLDRGRLTHRVEGGLRKANRATSMISGMTHVNEVLQTWTAKAVVQKFANMAHSGKGLSPKRLADLGLTPEMGERIAAQFRKEGNFEYARGPLSGKRVVRAHFDQWDDLEAREAFRNAAWRMAHQIIQKNDIGNMAMWMSSPTGKLLMQFRTFVVAAYEKQTLRLLHMRDTPAIMSALLSMSLAGAVYAVQEKLKSIGRSDADEYLEKRLSWDNLGKAAFARAGVSSILPMIMDTGAQAAMGGALFDYRPSGQPSDVLFGNPTTGLWNDLNGFLTHPADALRDGRSLRQSEVRAMLRILPFQNFLPVSMLLNSLIHNLPERASR